MTRPPLHPERLQQLPIAAELDARRAQRPGSGEGEKRRRGRGRHGQARWRRGGELGDGVVQPAGAHDDLDGEGVALQGDVEGGVGVVGCEVAGCGEGGFGEVDAKGGAGAGVAEAAETGEVEGAGGEEGGRVVGGPAVFAFVDAEDLERFEEGGEGDLEGGGGGVIVGVVGGGGGAWRWSVVKGGEERFV